MPNDFNIQIAVGCIFAALVVLIAYLGFAEPAGQNKKLPRRKRR